MILNIEFIIACLAVVVRIRVLLETDITIL